MVREVGSLRIQVVLLYLLTLVDILLNALAGTSDSAPLLIGITAYVLKVIRLHPKLLQRSNTRTLNLYTSHLFAAGKNMVLRRWFIRTARE